MSDTASSRGLEGLDAAAPQDQSPPGAQLRIVPSAPPTARNNGRSLALRVYQNVDELEELERLWDDLVAEYPLATIFCTWEWLVSWWRSFGRGRKLLVLALFESTSRLVGLAPLAVSSEPFFGSGSVRMLRFMGDGSEDSDNLDFPVLPGFEEMFASKILEYLQDQRDQWSVAQLNTMPMGSLVGRCLADSLKSSRWSCFAYLRNRSTVFLPATWDEYLAQLSTKDRRNFAYYGRRLRKLHSVRIHRCAGESELPECLDALFRLHQLRWLRVGKPGTFAVEARCKFYFDLSRHLLAKKWLELWIGELDGKIAAAQFAMRYGNEVYSLQEGYDPEHASDRIGFILRGEVLRQLISEGVRVYDFLGGDDQHKARWKAQAASYRDLHFAPAWSKGGMLLSCAHRSFAAKEWLRRRLQPSMWHFLHKANLALRRPQLSPQASSKASDPGS